MMAVASRMARFQFDRVCVGSLGMVDLERRPSGRPRPARRGVAHAADAAAPDRRYRAPAESADGTPTHAVRLGANRLVVLDTWLPSADDALSSNSFGRGAAGLAGLLNLSSTLRTRTRRPAERCSRRRRTWPMKRQLIIAACCSSWLKSATMACFALLVRLQFLPVRQRTMTVLDQQPARFRGSARRPAARSGCRTTRSCR